MRPKCFPDILGLSQRMPEEEEEEDEKTMKGP